MQILVISGLRAVCQPVNIDAGALNTKPGEWHKVHCVVQK